MLRAHDEIPAGVLEGKGWRKCVLGPGLRVLVGLAPELEVGDCKLGVAGRLLVELVHGGHYHKIMIDWGGIKDMCPIAPAKLNAKDTVKQNRSSYSY